MNNYKEMRESHLRSILKAFTWSIVATLTTMLIALVVTGEGYRYRRPHFNRGLPSMMDTSINDGYFHL